MGSIDLARMNSRIISTSDMRKYWSNIRRVNGMISWDDLDCYRLLHENKALSCVLVNNYFPEDCMRASRVRLFGAINFYYQVQHKKTIAFCVRCTEYGEPGYKNRYYCAVCTPSILYVFLRYECRHLNNANILKDLHDIEIKVVKELESIDIKDIRELMLKEYNIPCLW